MPNTSLLGDYVVAEVDALVMGFFGSDFRSLFRLACELVDAGSEIVRDITDLVSAGYYEEGEAVSEKAVRGLGFGLS